MKIKEKYINIIQVVVTIITLSVVVTTIIYPEAINYKTSIKDIRNKKEVVNVLEKEIKANEYEIETKILTMYSLEESSKIAQNKADSFKQLISNQDLIIHMPSILIYLEQKAIVTGVELNIEYNKIEEHENSNESEHKEEIQHEEEEDNGDTDKVVEEVVIKEKDKVSHEEEEITSKNEVGDVHKIPDIHGIRVTVIPLKIKGEYKNIREFIRHLDEIDYLEPSVIDLNSTGSDILGHIIINVFHGEVE